MSCNSVLRMASSRGVVSDIPVVVGSEQGSDKHTAFGFKVEKALCPVERSASGGQFLELAEVFKTQNPKTQNPEIVPHLRFFSTVLYKWTIKNDVRGGG